MKIQVSYLGEDICAIDGISGKDKQGRFIGAFADDCDFISLGYFLSDGQGNEGFVYLEDTFIRDGIRLKRFYLRDTYL